MAKLQKEIISGNSRLAVELKLREWRQRLEPKICIQNIHPVEPIKQPSGHENQPHHGKLKPIDTHQIIVEYTNKSRPRRHGSRTR
jgi:hypothetical protein